MENTQDQQSSLERPRFRSDLVAQPIEEEGVRYVDVTDPSSSQTFRFYDVEYSIACAMDGARDLDNLGEWTRVELGIEASPEELQSVIKTLADLGYLEGVSVSDQPQLEFDPGTSGIPESIDAGTAGDTQADSPAHGGGGQPGGGQPGGSHSDGGFTDESASSYDEPLQAPPTREAVPQAVPHPNVAAAEHAREATIELDAVEPIDDHMDAVDEMDAHQDTHANVTAPGSPPPAPRGELPPSEPPKRDTAAETSFAGLLDDSPPTPPPPAEPSELPRSMAGRSPQPTGHLDDEDPTQVPSAHIEDEEDDEEEDDVSVDLSSHLALDKHEVQEAVRSSRIHSVPPLPAETSESSEAIREATSSSPLSMKPTATSAAEPSLETSPVEPAAYERDRPGASPSSDEPKVAPATPLPSRPPASQPPRVFASRPIEPTKMPPPARAPQPKKSSFGTWVVFLAILLLLGGLTYAFKDRIFGTDDYGTKPQGQNPTQAPTPDKPTETVATVPPTAPTDKPIETAKPPTENPKAPEATLPSAAVRSEAAPAAAGPQTVASSSPGQVVWVAEKGATVEAGAPVAKLLGYAKWEAKLKDATDRGGFYGKKLAEAQAKGDQAAIEAAQSKVNEKKEIADEASKALEKLVITAPAGGKVKPLVTVGADIKDGAQVAEVAGDGTPAAAALRASFDVGDGATQYAEGKPAAVAAKGAPDKQFAAVVEKIDGGKVDVKIVAAGGGAVPAAGDEIMLLPPKK